MRRDTALSSTYPTEHSRLGWVFLISIALTVYASLYPFDFRFALADPGAWWRLTHNWPDQFDIFVLRDAIVNLLFYLPVGIFGRLWIVRAFPVPKARATWLALLMGTALSACMELLQTYDDHRQTSPMDLLMNAISTAIGIALAQAYETLVLSRRRADGSPSRHRSSGAWLLLILWVGYQTVPLFPRLSRYAIAAKLEVLTSLRAFSLGELAAVMVDCLVVARLVEAVAGRKYARFAAPVALLALPGRLLIVNRTFTWPEAIGAALAALLWSGWLWRAGNRTALLAWLAVLALLVRGLAPYRFGAAAQPFHWIPFSVSLGYDRGLALIPFLAKGFLYGAAVWLFAESGRGFLRPAIGVAALLGAIEWAQVYLPGRTAESTDPLYALMLALILKLLHSADARWHAERNGLQEL